MSWWTRSSPQEFARMTPKAKMLAGLSGYGIGSAGIESRSAGNGRLLSMATVQSVAVPQLARAVAAQQTRVQLPRGMRFGFGALGRGETFDITATAPTQVFQPEAPSAPVIAQLGPPAPAAAPTPVYAIDTAMSPAYSSPVSQLAPVREQSRNTPSSFATGREGTPDLLQQKDADFYTGVPDPGQSQSQSPVDTGSSTSAPSQKVPRANGENGIFNLKAGVASAATGPLGVPQWVWVVGGLGVVAVVLYKVSK